MQIGSHLPLANVTVPATCISFNSALSEIISFDFWDTDDFFDETFEYDEIDPPSARFENLGYESYFAPRNMGTLTIFIAIIYFLVFVLMLRKLC